MVGLSFLDFIFPLAGARPPVHYAEHIVDWVVCTAIALSSWLSIICK